MTNTTGFEFYAALAVTTYGIRVAEFNPGPASIGLSVFDWYHEHPETLILTPR